MGFNNLVIMIDSNPQGIANPLRWYSSGDFFNFQITKRKIELYVPGI